MAETNDYHNGKEEPTIRRIDLSGVSSDGTEHEDAGVAYVEKNGGIKRGGGGGKRYQISAEESQSTLYMDALLLLFVALIELTASSKLCDARGYCAKEYQTAVWVGGFGLVGPLIFLAAQRWFGFKIQEAKTTPGNGYFSCWGGLLVSAHFGYHAVPKFQAFLDQVRFSSLDERLVLAIFTSSGIELMAAVVDCMHRGTCMSESSWAITIGFVSVGVTLSFLTYPDILAGFGRFVGFFLAVWWIVGTGMLTFEAPFPAASNGFFATWAALLLSVYYAFKVGQGPDDREK
eukprot:jgi/Bigna1/91745/estExt_fgenesh1_pg.C_1160036